MTDPDTPLNPDDDDDGIFTLIESDGTIITFPIEEYEEWFGEPPPAKTPLPDDEEMALQCLPEFIQGMLRGIAKIVGDWLLENENDNLKVAKNAQDAWEMQHKFEGSSAWIQWKGTNVCMDLVCAACGTGWHLDADFCYYVKCPTCGRVYMCNGHIELIEIEEHENLSITEFTGDTLTFGPEDEIPNPES